MFSLNHRLSQDTIFITDLPLCRLLLMNNCNFPWLILVPRRFQAKEIIDLQPSDRLVLMEEICLVSEKMQTFFKPDKINVASIGNIVPQLHIHIVARYVSDAAWPGLVWGSTNNIPYTETVRKDMLKKLSNLFTSN